MRAARLPVFVDASLCTPCGGNCCKTYPGIVSPEDVGAPDLERMTQRLEVMLRSGRYTIDWWEGDDVEFVRPAQVGHEGKHRHGGGAGACSLLSESGCVLEHDDRPLGCRGLKPVPKAAGGCEPHESKEHQVHAWEPYQELLRAVRARMADVWVDGGGVSMVDLLGSLWR